MGLLVPTVVLSVSSLQSIFLLPVASSLLPLGLCVPYPIRGLCTSQLTQFNSLFMESKVLPLKRHPLPYHLPSPFLVLRGISLNGDLFSAEKHRFCFRLFVSPKAEGQFSAVTRGKKSCREASSKRRRDLARETAGSCAPKLKTDRRN